MNELDETKGKLKTELKRAKIEQIIQKHRGKRKIERKITDWKAMYEAEVKAHEATKVNLKVAIAAVRAILSLKPRHLMRATATVKPRSAVRAISLLKPIDSMRATVLLNPSV